MSEWDRSAVGNLANQYASPAVRTVGRARQPSQKLLGAKRNRVVDSLVERFAPKAD